jgi:hypothetical protein
LLLLPTNAWEITAADGIPDGKPIPPEHTNQHKRGRKLFLINTKVAENKRSWRERRRDWKTERIWGKITGMNGINGLRK